MTNLEKKYGLWKTTATGGVPRLARGRWGVSGMYRLLRSMPLTSSQWVLAERFLREINGLLETCERIEIGDAKRILTKAKTKSTKPFPKTTIPVSSMRKSVTISKS